MTDLSGRVSDLEDRVMFFEQGLLDRPQTSVYSQLLSTWNQQYTELANTTTQMNVIVRNLQSLYANLNNLVTTNYTGLLALFNSLTGDLSGVVLFVNNYTGYGEMLTGVEQEVGLFNNVPLYRYIVEAQAPGDEITIDLSSVLSGHNFISIDGYYYSSGEFTVYGHPATTGAAAHMHLTADGILVLETHGIDFSGHVFIQYTKNA